MAVAFAAVHKTKPRHLAVPGLFFMDVERRGERGVRRLAAPARAGAAIRHYGRTRKAVSYGWIVTSETVLPLLIGS